MRPWAAMAALSSVILCWPATARAGQALDRVDAVNAQRGLPERDTAPPPRTTIPIEVEPVRTAESGGGSVLVGAVTLSGLQAMTPADFADTIVERVGHTLDSIQLAGLASEIAARARDRGYAFATAWIESQRLANGVLVVHVDEGRIDEIRFDGPEQSAVRRALAPLISGKPARVEEVERRLLIAGDIDGVRIRSSRFLREKDRGILLVRVTQDHVSARAEISNDGTRPIGPEELHIDVDFNGLLAADDALVVTYLGTPAQFGELQFGRVRYVRRVSGSGTELALVALATHARPGAAIAPLDITSRSWFAGFDLLQPLLRRRDASLWLNAELGVRDSVLDRAGARLRHDRLATARVTLHGYSDFAGGRLYANATLSQGLGILGATRASDPLASRNDADGVFTALAAGSDWTRDLSGPLSVRLAMQMQIASEPLLLAEEIGLGGSGFLRGYDWSERSGDDGAMASIELRYMINHPFGVIPYAQLYAFVDGGTVTNLKGGDGGGTLASAGGGMRAGISEKMGANVEVAVPLSGPRYDSGDDTPKINFRIVHSF